MADIISFTINGTKYDIDPSNTTVGPTTRLVSFIRSNANLTGTKTMCMEGGCGACLVQAISVDPVSGQSVIRSVNACLVPVLSCNGWNINTVESLGNRKVGYNAIQQRLVGFGGTQCGYCSSGMVMNMFALQQARGETLTMQQIEDNYDGNLCRCTGFRPILDAMKSFAIDAPEELKAKARDIEELCKTTCPLKPDSGICQGQSACGGIGGPANQGCNVGAQFAGGCCQSQLSPQPQGCCQGSQKPTGCCQGNSTPIVIPSVDAVFPGGVQWIKATDLASAFTAVRSFVDAGLRYRIVGGNTGIGVFKNEGSYGAYLDVNDVTEMRTTTVTPTAITFGGTNTLSFLIEFFQTNAARPGFEYLAGMSQHLRRVANTSVRNLATLSGNLMMKHDHHEFPSDIFVLLETVGARLNIGTSPTNIQAYSPLDFLDTDMSGGIIVSVTLSQKTGYSFRSYKITKRHQNAHAYVNAGFLFRLDVANNFRILEKPTIVFGGINPTFSHAVATENFLTGTELGSINTLKAAVAFLQDEINPDYIPPDASAEYRKKLAINLFYKTVLGLLGSSISNRNETGAEDLPHLLTRGEQIYDADTGDSPLYKPVHKLEAPAQVSGEAEYINDIPAVPGELFAAFVQATEGSAVLASLDTSAAIAIPGVVAVLTAADIPGKNDNMGFAGTEDEPIFVEVGQRIQFHGQAIALVVANNRGTCNRALPLVKATYTDIQKPVIRIEEAIENAKQNGTWKTVVSASPKKGSPNAITKRVSGTFRTGGQAHFQMEQMITIAKPTESGLDVYASTQWTDHVQDVIASALDIPNNK
ncbi:unnamed protein product [Allacma fusca]|uniref:Xanthine dehydrogenase n=1 Tax=Allacma fusca TaxID=39272 RepID=A0A8J2PUP5_9HEXA|nr:unnamed protein product [Allacma fusca]